MDINNFIVSRYRDKVGIIKLAQGEFCINLLHRLETNVSHTLTIYGGEYHSLDNTKCDLNWR